MSRRRPLTAFALALAVMLPATTGKAQAQEPPLDLATLPLPEGAEAIGARRQAQLSYNAREAVEPAFKAVAKALADRGWNEAPGAYVTPQAASASFQKGAARLSLSVMPGTDPNTPGGATVSITQYGDVDLTALPLPEGAKSVYAFPAGAMFQTAAPVAETAAALRAKLLAAGWTPYGEAGDTRFYKRGKIRLTANVSAMPAQPGQTAIQLASELLSVDLPLVPDATRAQYADPTAQLSFDTKSLNEDVFAFYKKALAASGFQPTTDQPVRDRFKTFLIFRNPAGDLRTLEVHNVDGLTRGDLTHQTAAEVAAIDERIRKELAEKATRKPADLPLVALPIPEGARNLTRSKTEIEFQVAAGSAATAVAPIRKFLKAEGWSESQTVGNATAGTTTFEKSGARLTILHADPGFIPAEITITASGASLSK